MEDLDPVKVFGFDSVCDAQAVMHFFCSSAFGVIDLWKWSELYFYSTQKPVEMLSNIIGSLLQKAYKFVNLFPSCKEKTIYTSFPLYMLKNGGILDIIMRLVLGV